MMGGRDVLPQRKQIRLPQYDYGSVGYYFVTICTREKRKCLCNIESENAPYELRTFYTNAGRIAFYVLENMSDVDKFVVMPNHVHILFYISENTAALPSLVRYFKRSVTQKLGKSIWQRGYYDHVIANEADYLRIWQYIDGNPAKWIEDEYYIG